MNFDQALLLSVLALAATCINAYVGKVNWEERHRLREELEDCKEKLKIKNILLRK